MLICYCMKQASKDTRERALLAYKNGVSIAEICKSYNICRKTFYSWRKRDEEGGQQIPKPKGHPPRYLSHDDLERIKELHTKNNSIFAREIIEHLELSCHISVIYRALKELGLTYKKKACLLPSEIVKM